MSAHPQTSCAAIFSGRRYGSHERARQLQALDYVELTRVSDSSDGCEPEPEVVQVAIIGAGVAGLQTLRAVLRAGLEAIVLESRTEVGGSYLDLVRRGHGSYPIGPWELFQLPGFTWPPALKPAGDTATALDVLRYVRKYAEALRLDSHVRCGCTVTGVNQVQDGSWILSYSDATETCSTGLPGDASAAVGAGMRCRDGASSAAAGASTGGGKHSHTLVASFVIVATGIYSSPYIPDIPGRDKFQGLQLHANGIRGSGGCRRSSTGHSRSVREGGQPQFGRILGAYEGRRVAVLGTSRQTPELAGLGAAASAAATISMVAPEVRCPLPPMVTCLGEQQLLHTRCFGRCIPPYYKTTAIDRLVHKVLYPVRTLFWGCLTAAVKREVRPPHGGPKDLCDDLQQGGQPSDPVTQRLMRDPRVTWVQGHVAALDAGGVVLADGRHVPADVIVYCTGYCQRYSFLPQSVIDVLAAAPPGAVAAASCTTTANAVPYSTDGGLPGASQHSSRAAPSLGTGVPSLLAPRAAPGRLPGGGPVGSGGGLKQRQEVAGLYRNMVHCGVRNLAFIGCEAVTLNPPLTAALQAEWLARLLCGQLLLPPAERMIHEMELARRWAEREAAARQTRRPTALTMSATSLVAAGGMLPGLFGGGGNGCTAAGASSAGMLPPRTAALAGLFGMSIASPVSSVQSSGHADCDRKGPASKGGTKAVPDGAPAAAIPPPLDAPARLFAHLGLHTQAYHDSLLHDLGVNPRRKGVVPFAECFLSYTARDYTAVVCAPLTTAALTKLPTADREPQQLAAGMMRGCHGSPEDLKQAPSADESSYMVYTVTPDRVVHSQSRDSNRLAPTHYSSGGSGRVPADKLLEEVVEQREHPPRGWGDAGAAGPHTGSLSSSPFSLSAALSNSRLTIAKGVPRIDGDKPMASIDPTNSNNLFSEGSVSAAASMHGTVAKCSSVDSAFATDRPASDVPPLVLSCGRRCPRVAARGSSPRATAADLPRIVEQAGAAPAPASPSTSAPAPASPSTSAYPAAATRGVLLAGYGSDAGRGVVYSGEGAVSALASTGNSTSAVESYGDELCGQALLGQPGGLALLLNPLPSARHLRQGSSPSAHGAKALAVSEGALATSILPDAPSSPSQPPQQPTMNPAAGGSPAEPPEQTATADSTAILSPLRTTSASAARLYGITCLPYGVRSAVGPLGADSQLHPSQSPSSSPYSSSSLSGGSSPSGGGDGSSRGRESSPCGRSGVSENVRGDGVWMSGKRPLFTPGSGQRSIATTGTGDRTEPRALLGHAAEPFIGGCSPSRHTSRAATLSGSPSTPVLPCTPSGVTAAFRPGTRGEGTDANKPAASRAGSEVAEAVAAGRIRGYVPRPRKCVVHRALQSHWRMAARRQARLMSRSLAAAVDGATTGSRSDTPITSWQLLAGVTKAAVTAAGGALNAATDVEQPPGFTQPPLRLKVGCGGPDQEGSAHVCAAEAVAGATAVGASPFNPTANSGCGQRNVHTAAGAADFGGARAGGGRSASNAVSRRMASSAATASDHLLCVSPSNTRYIPPYEISATIGAVRSGPNLLMNPSQPGSTQSLQSGRSGTGEAEPCARSGLGRSPGPPAPTAPLEDALSEALQLRSPSQLTEMAMARDVRRAGGTNLSAPQQTLTASGPFTVAGADDGTGVMAMAMAMAAAGVAVGGVEGADGGSDCIGVFSSRLPVHQESLDAAGARQIVTSVGRLRLQPAAATAAWRGRGGMAGAGTFLRHSQSLVTEDLQGRSSSPVTTQAKDPRTSTGTLSLRSRLLVTATAKDTGSCSGSEKQAFPRSPNSPSAASAAAGLSSPLIHSSCLLSKLDDLLVPGALAQRSRRLSALGIRSAAMGLGSGNVPQQQGWDARGAAAGQDRRGKAVPRPAAGVGGGGGSGGGGGDARGEGPAEREEVGGRDGRGGMGGPGGPGSTNKAILRQRRQLDRLVSEVTLQIRASLEARGQAGPGRSR